MSKPNEGIPMEENEQKIIENEIVNQILNQMEEEQKNDVIDLTKENDKKMEEEEKEEKELQHEIERYLKQKEETLENEIPWLEFNSEEYTVQYEGTGRNKKKKFIPLIKEIIDMKIKDIDSKTIEHKQGAKMEYNEIKEVLHQKDEIRTKGFGLIQFINSKNIKNVELRMLIELRSNDFDEQPVYYQLIINKNEVKINMLEESQDMQRMKRSMRMKEFYGPEPELPELPEYPERIDLDKYKKDKVVIRFSSEELERGEEIRKRILENKKLGNDEEVERLTKELDNLKKKRRTTIEKYLPENEETKKIIEEAERIDEIRRQNRDKYYKTIAERKKIREERKPRKRRDTLEEIKRIKQINHELEGKIEELKQNYIEISKEPERDKIDLDNKNQRMNEIEMEIEKVNDNIYNNMNDIKEKERMYKEMIKDVIETEQIQMYPVRDMIRLEVDTYIEYEDNKGVFHRNQPNEPVIRYMERDEVREMKRKKQEMKEKYKRMEELSNYDLNEEIEERYNYINFILDKVNEFDLITDPEDRQKVIEAFNEEIPKEDGSGYTEEEVSNKIKEFRELKKEIEDVIEAKGYMEKYNELVEKLNKRKKLKEEEIEWLNKNTDILIPDIRNEMKAKDLYKNKCTIELINKNEKRVVNKNGEKEVKKYNENVMIIDFTINKGDDVTFLKLYIIGERIYMTMRCSMKMNENFYTIINQGEIKQITFSYSGTKEEIDMLKKQSNEQIEKIKTEVNNIEEERIEKENKNTKEKEIHMEEN